MIDSSEKILLNQIESLCPENWPRRGGGGGGRGGLKGEQDVMSLCERSYRIDNFSVILETFPRLLGKGS
jgi:hypothetical protein